MAKDPLPLSRASIAPPPTGRFAGPTNTQGERTLPAALSGWSYHTSEGFKLVNNPLGPYPVQGISQTNLTTLLAGAGYRTTPLFTLSSDDGAVKIDVYASIDGAERMIVLTVPGQEMREFILAKGFPSLLEVLEKLKTLLEFHRTETPQPIQPDPNWKMTLPPQADVVAKPETDTQPDEPPVEERKSAGIAARIRQRREERGIHLVTLASILGVSRNTLASYESGKTEPTVSELIRIANALGCSAQDLLGNMADIGPQ